MEKLDKYLTKLTLLLFSLEVWQTHQLITLKIKSSYRERVIKDKGNEHTSGMPNGWWVLQELLSEEEEREREVVKWVFGWGVFINYFQEQSLNQYNKVSVTKYQHKFLNNKKSTNTKVINVSHNKDQGYANKICNVESQTPDLHNLGPSLDSHIKLRNNPL